MLTIQPAPGARHCWHGGPPPKYQPRFTEAAIAEAQSWARSQALPHAEVQRARLAFCCMRNPTCAARRRHDAWARAPRGYANGGGAGWILLAAEGVPNHEIASRTGCSQPTVRLWRLRFSEGGVAGLEEREGRSHPFTYSEEDFARVITTTLAGPPEGSTHWSTRTLAGHLGMSRSTVQRICREHRLQPHRESTFKYSNDPQLEAKVTDIVGLYLNPPDKALVRCVDEKTMIQALDRTQPLLPMKPGQIARHTHDYVRNGTTDLFAALDVATGAVTHRFYERHRAIEFLDFLRLVARTHPRKELHLVLDNSSTHETDDIRTWLGQHPRIHLHFHTHQR